jgi:hypothetical protein
MQAFWSVQYILPQFPIQVALMPGYLQYQNPLICHVTSSITYFERFPCQAVFMQNKRSTYYLCFGIQSRFLSLKRKKDSVWNTDGRYEGFRHKAHQQQLQLKLKTALSSITGINFCLHEYCLSIFSLVKLRFFCRLELFTHMPGNACIFHS